MPLVRRRLDCCICIVEQSQQEIASLKSIFVAIESAQKKEEHLPCRSFFSCSFDSSDVMRLYANHQGGYRVRCPSCSSNIAPEFSTAVHRWRGGADFSMTCPSCAQTYPLSSALGIPPFAFSRAAIVLHDVEEADLGYFWHEQCMRSLKDYRVVFRRVG